jgi:cell division protein FtsQ
MSRRHVHAAKTPESTPESEDANSKPREESKVLAVFRVLLGGALMLAIGGGLVWGARRYVRTSPRFSVTEIVTTGAKHRRVEEIAAMAGVAKGDNVFSLDLSAARARLTADPWIESAEVTRLLPSKITIRVTEREAAGIVAMQEGTYLVTRDGAILKRLEAGDPVDLHVVTGMTLKTLLDDREGAARTLRQALELIADYEHSPLSPRMPVQEAHVEPNGDMTLVVGKTSTALRMGAAPYRKKLEQAVRIVAELDRRGGKPDVIMLDDEARPERVVVRMR